MISRNVNVVTALCVLLANSIHHYSLYIPILFPVGENKAPQLVFYLCLLSPATLNKVLRYLTLPYLTLPYSDTSLC